MTDSSKALEAVEWYSKNRIIYEALARKVASIIEEILKPKGINYHSISKRAKPLDSYKEKASKGEYKEPRSEIMDMAGIRVITYTNSDAKRVFEIIENTFEIDPQHSIDKGEELGVDKVGYRSIHCVGCLGKERVKLPENKIFKNKRFEIQIRTILQHAWAEFEHDRNYKFSGVLPKDMRRRLTIISGNLELIDREFDSLSKSIDDYAADVGKRTELGDLAVPVNSTSLRAYMNKRFEPLIKNDIVMPSFVDQDESIIEELSIMGINSLEKLDAIFPKDFAKKVGSFYSQFERTTFLGLLRYVLMIHDADTYFKKAWKTRWTALRGQERNLLQSYEVNCKKLAKEHNFRLEKIVFEDLRHKKK